MKLRLFASILTFGLAASAIAAQQPHGAREALDNMASQPATHTAFTLDKDALQTAGGLLDSQPGADRAIAALNSITFENFRYHQAAFYIPESMASLVAAYNRAGWKHLVNQNVSPREATTPHGQLTDLWLHFHGAEIDDVTVLIRSPKNMSLIEVSGALRPLDLVHLSGHFGIPKVDPDAVMVPAPPGK
jgi:hypothetical protein